MTATCNGIHRINEKPPPADERVIVVTGIFRCLGYRDVEGVWRHGKDAARIENVLGWYFFDHAER